MTPRELRDLACELAARLRAEIEALPESHPRRRWPARHDAAEPTARPLRFARISFSRSTIGLRSETQ